MGGRSRRTSDSSKRTETENVYIGAVKLQEQEIILMCGYTSMCELACMLCALLHDLGYVKLPPPPETKQGLGNQYFVAMIMSLQDCRGGAAK